MQVAVVPGSENKQLAVVPNSKKESSEKKKNYSWKSAGKWSLVWGMGGFLGVAIAAWKGFKTGFAIKGDIGSSGGSGHKSSGGGGHHG